MKNAPAGENLWQTIIGQLHLTEQLDALNLDIVNLRDLVQDGEIELVLGQASKSSQQKIAFLEKIIIKLLSPELKNTFQFVLHGGDIDFFGSTNLPIFLDTLQSAITNIAVVTLTVAITFKPEDLRELSQEATDKIGRPVVFDLRVDRTLLGGAIVRYGNYISDYSLKTRLEQFRTNWRSAVVETNHV